MNNYDWYEHLFRIPLLSLYTYSVVQRNGATYDTISRQYVASFAQATSTLSVPPPPAFNNTTANMAEHSIIIHNANGRGISYGLYDILGRLIMQSQPFDVFGDTIQIPVSNVSVGTYILKLQNNTGGTKSFKLVKDQ